jgi:hypothetical protein
MLHRLSPTAAIRNGIKNCPRHKPQSARTRKNTTTALSPSDLQGVLQNGHGFSQAAKKLLRRRKKNEGMTPALPMKAINSVGGAPLRATFSRLAHHLTPRCRQNAQRNERSLRGTHPTMSYAFFLMERTLSASNEKRRE